MSKNDDLPQLNRLERKEESMLLTWSNKLESELSYRTLLYWCPCAKCSPLRDDEDTASELESEIEKLLLSKPQVSKVGRYALKFEFSGRLSGPFCPQPIKKEKIRIRRINLFI